MGTLTEKINYLKQTKQYIKEAIISKGQSVSSSDTFRSYASKIENITTESALESKIIRQNGHYYPTGGYDGFSDVDVGVGQIGETYEAENTTDNTYQVNDKVWLNYRQMLITDSSENNQFYTATYGGWKRMSIICDKTTSNLYYNQTGSVGKKWDLINNTINEYSHVDFSSTSHSYASYIEDDIPIIVRPMGSNSSIGACTKATENGIEYLSYFQLGYGCYITGPDAMSKLSYFPDGTKIVNSTCQAGVIWKYQGKYYLFLGIDYRGYIYALDMDNKTATQLSYVGNGGVYAENSFGFTSDKKYMIKFSANVSKTSSLTIIRLDYSNDSCTGTKVNTQVLPSSIQSILTGSCTTWFNPQNNTIVIGAKSISNINQFLICKYNPSTNNFENITTEVNLPNAPITGHNDEYNIWLSTDYKTFIFASTNSNNPYLNIYYMDNAEGWVITNYNNINQDSITGYAAETITPNTVGNVIVGIQGGGSNEDAYNAKLTLQGVVDGLPQPTEEEIIEDTLEILTNI